MAEVTAQMIKELRERTGIGMTKCKEALEEAKGNMDEAISILRKSGLAAGVKKQGRQTNEGVILFKDAGNLIAIAEANAETDFVVKNDRFQEFARNVVEEVALKNPPNLETFLQASYSKDPSITMDQYRSLIIQTIGENIQVSRILVLPKAQDTSWGIYSHLGGKILSAVQLSAPGEEALARDIAMHVAALSPDYLNPEAVPGDIIEKEKEIARAQIQGKPANVMEKIVEGKVNAFFDQVCLSRQKFVKDHTQSINDIIQAKAKATGKPITLLGFVRWMVGQA